jgi:hypothetical protein
MTTTLTLRTATEVAELKASWLQDPHWDIHETEGFEAHKSELLAFQTEHEARWNNSRAQALAEENARLAKRAHDLGIPGGGEVVRLIEKLEARVATLETEVDGLRAQNQ